MSHEPLAIRRILYAADALIQRPAELESLLRLAAQLDAELYGLFVEDTNLHRLAGLPFAREVRAASAATRSLGPAEIERGLRAQAALARETLVAHAARHKVRWSFQVTRGQWATQVRAAALATDLVAMTFSAGALAGLTQVAATIETAMHGAPCPLLMLPPGAGIHPPFVVVYDGSPASAHALQLAALFAQAESAGVTVLLAAMESSVLPRLQAEVEALLAGTRVTAQYPVLLRADAVTIARALRTVKAGTLFMAADSPVFKDEVRSRLLEEIECAVLLT